MTERSAPFLSLVPPWRVEAPRTLLSTPIFALRARQASSALEPTRRGEFFYLDTPDWVNVVPLTDAGDVVLIEQYRHGLGEVTLEIPGGMVEPGESPLDAARRELREETGYTGEPAELIGVCTPNPAIQCNRCHTAMVRGVRLTCAPAVDTHEEIGVRLVPLAEIPQLIRAGVIHHALVIAAFHHLRLSEITGGRR
jgi:8-oxo-dGTP pyrophosphatase MutT (NUDIX family)